MVRVPLSISNHWLQLGGIYQVRESNKKHYHLINKQNIKPGKVSYYTKLVHLHILY